MTTGQAASTDRATPVRDVIVVGVDGSPSSERALRWAQFLAVTAGGSVDVVAAWQPDVAGGWMDAGELTIPEDWPAELDANKIATDTVDQVFGKHRPAGLQIVTLQGNAASALLQASSDTRMLVVGSRGHGGFAGLLLGSTSSACVQHATCPVLVIHGSTPLPPKI